MRTQYDIEYLQGLLNTQTEPIENLAINNITIPNSMKLKRSTQGEESIVTDIRMLFNTITTTNIDSIKEKIFKIVTEKVQTMDDLNKIVKEIFDNFLTSDQNILLYLDLLNKIHMIVLSLDEVSVKTSPSLGNLFIMMCRENFFNSITLQKIKKLSILNHDDEDEFDNYNREKDKIIILIILICELINRKSNLSLNFNHMDICLTRLYDNYMTVLKRLESFIDPETGDCYYDKEDESEVLRKMLIMYAEQIYIFLLKKGEEYYTYKKDLIDKIKSELVPSLLNDFMISNYKNLNFMKY